MSLWSRLAVVVFAVALPLACVTRKSGKSDIPPETVRRANVTDYSSEGKLWFIGADLRASRMRGPREMLPINLILVNKNAGPARVARESFVLSTPDGTTLPVVSYKQFEADYRDERADLRIGRDYIVRHTGRFPERPFTWRELELFPVRNSGVVPREFIDTRSGELIHGYIYFAAPSEDYRFPEGKYRLLLKPKPSDETFVVELFPF